MTKEQADNVERVLSYAVDAHYAQRDLNTHPYVLHPIRQAMNFSLLPDQDKAYKLMCVTLLHDTIEDTHVTEADLRTLLPNDHDIVDAVLLLTKEEGEDYYEYIKKLKASGNDLAIEVKISDLKDNSNIERVVPGERGAEMVTRYIWAYRYLTEAYSTEIER